MSHISIPAMFTRSQKKILASMEEMSPAGANGLRRSSRLLKLSDLIDVPIFYTSPPRMKPASKTALKTPEEPEEPQEPQEPDVIDYVVRVPIVPVLPPILEMVTYVSHEDFFDASASQMELFECHFADYDDHMTYLI